MELKGYILLALCFTCVVSDEVEQVALSNLNRETIVKEVKIETEEVVPADNERDGGLHKEYPCPDPVAIAPCVCIYENGDMDLDCSNVTR